MIMKERIVSTFLMLLLASPFCYASGYTLAVANHIIAILVIIVIALVVMGSYILRNNRIFRQRNEQLRRILTALDDYRAIVGNEALSLDEQEDLLKDKLAKSKKVNTIQKGEDQSFFVKMDARVNKEKPFTDPDFDQEALIQFMGVSHETFCQLVPRYTATLPERRTTSTPFAQNMLQRFSWSTQTIRQKTLPASAVSRIPQHTSVPSSLPSASRPRTI